MHQGRAHLQHAIAQALFTGLHAGSAVEAGGPEVHTSHVAVDVQDEYSLNVIRQHQGLPVTHHLHVNATPFLSFLEED